MRTYASTQEIQAANERAGSHFFDTSAMRFFDSRILPEVYNGVYFITSERYEGEPRKYTLRMVRTDGNIETIGDFNVHATKEEAVAVIKTLPTQLQDALELAISEYNGETPKGEFLKHALIEPRNSPDRSFSMDSFCGACTWLCLHGIRAGQNVISSYFGAQYKEAMEEVAE